MLIHSILGSLLVAFGLYMLEATATHSPSGWLFLIVWIAVGYWFYKKPTVTHIWRKSFILFAIESFLLPIATFIFSVVFVANQTEGAAEAIGGVLGGTFLIVALGFLGFFLGIVFLLIGLFVFKVPTEVHIVKSKK